ncbi:MAG: hypothetical protein ACC631_04215 [Halocynthiibacter sp.]
MTKSFIATVLAAALTITSISAVPARAGAEDVAKILLGLAVVAGVASVINNNNRNRNRSIAPVARRASPPHSHRAPVVTHHNRAVTPHRARNTVPETCLRSFDTRSGSREAYGARCIARNASWLNLPESCAREFRTSRGWRVAYSPRCLRRAGFVTASRGH